MKILHVIGKVGAGKSTFIKKFFPQAPCFDIKTVYEQFDVDPVILQDPQIYRQFANALQYTLDGFFRHYVQEPLVIIESSGINQTLNQTLAFKHPIILIVESSYSKSIHTSRPYATKLNPIIQEALDSSRIVPHVKYDVKLNQFTPKKPEDLLNKN